MLLGYFLLVNELDCVPEEFLICNSHLHTIYTTEKPLKCHQLSHIYIFHRFIVWYFCSGFTINKACIMIILLLIFISYVHNWCRGIIASTLCLKLYFYLSAIFILLAVYFVQTLLMRSNFPLGLHVSSGPYLRDEVWVTALCAQTLSEPKTMPFEIPKVIFCTWGKMTICMLWQRLFGCDMFWAETEMHGLRQ